jgi:hydrogenase nickel incorporation protein HypA/HybF
MHELSIAESLLKIINEEMEKHGVSRLIRVKIVCGQMSAIVPDALDMAFEVLTVGTPQEGAHIELEELPVRVRCRECGREFCPSREEIYLMPCPHCDTELGHTMLSGKELYIEHIEAE